MLWRGGVALLACNYITGKFIGISTFFNPGRHQNKVDNFRLFRASVKAQGLQMLCVELTFGEESFQLRPDDCDILLQRRTAAGTRCLTLTLTLTLINLTLTLTTDLNLTTDPHQAGNTLWQKERLLNIAIENLPNTVEKVMWLDSDLIFLNDDWVAETASNPSPYPNPNPSLSLTPTLILTLNITLTLTPTLTLTLTPTLILALPLPRCPRRPRCLTATPSCSPLAG